jgi:lysophospholipase L1-like esterase
MRLTATHATARRAAPGECPWRGWLALLLLVAAAFAGCDRSPPLPRLAGQDVILAFGDSLTYGTGAEEAESYPAQLERRLGLRVVRAGVPGETTSEGRRRLPAALDEHAPRVVLLCLGGNDFLRREDEAATRENLRAMLSLLAQRGIGVLLIGVPRGLIGGESAPLYAELAREFRVPLEKKALADILGRRALKSDPIHPNAAGYARLAEEVAKALRSAGAV